VIDASRDARPDAPIGCDAIAPSPVTFHMTPQAGVNFCVNNCSTIWLSIFPAGGTTPLNVTRSCITTCDQCQPIACGATSRANPGLDSGAGAPADPVACIPPQPVKVEGETYTWSGVLWEPSKCGAFGYSCLNQVCGTPPGKYVARMCANRRTSDAGFCTYDPTPTCVDVPFDYPAAGVVEGTLR